MPENRTKRSKKIHKLLPASGFREPYQIIMDYSFAKGVRTSSIGLGHFHRLMRGQCKLSIPDCEYQKYKPFHKDRGDITGQCEIIKCKHTDESDKICVLNIIRDDNRHHYILCTSDRDTMERAKRVKNLPMVKTSASAIHFEPNSLSRMEGERMDKPAGLKELRKLQALFDDNED